MTQGHTLSGPPNPLQALLRLVFVAVAAVAGFFMLAASAAFAFFIIIGVVIFGFIVFCVLWLKAKITGKPMLFAFMPKSAQQQYQTFHDMQKNTEASKTSARPQNTQDGPLQTGPVLDAHKTPDGWSVDTE